MSYDRPSRPNLAVAIAIAVLSLVAAGCSFLAPSPSPVPTLGPPTVTTPDDALAAVIATDPRLTGLTVLDPDMIGQSAWAEVQEASGVGAFIVAVTIGWGDCQAGCIDRHTWSYSVLPDGTVELQSEEGAPVPADAWPSPGGDGRTGLLITATGGPVCPVVQDPPDPDCADRPVIAEVIIRDVAGDEVDRVTLDASGFAFVEVPAGGYIVEGPPVDGLMGTPGPVSATVADGGGTPVALVYDTGIR